MKTLAFAASNSSQSINRKLVDYAARLIQTDILPNAAVDFLDINDFEMPLYSFDRENADGIPHQAHAFRDAIGAADALVISFAEHNGGYPAAFKNLFDWTSRIDRDIFQGKPLVALATSPGPGGAGRVLGIATAAAPIFGAALRGQFSLPSFNDNFSTETNEVTDQTLRGDLIAALSSLK